MWDKSHQPAPNRYGSMLLILLENVGQSCHPMCWILQASSPEFGEVWLLSCFSNKFACCVVGVCMLCHGASWYAYTWYPQGINKTRNKQDQGLSVTSSGSSYAHLHTYLWQVSSLTAAVTNDWTRSFWCTSIHTYIRTHPYTHQYTHTYPHAHTHPFPHTQCTHIYTVYFTFHYSKTVYNGYNGVKLKSGQDEHALKHMAHQLDLTSKAETCSRI